MKPYLKNYCTIGKIMYLLAMVELSVYDFFKGDFAMTRPPHFDFLNTLNPTLAYLGSALLLICIVMVWFNLYGSYALICMIGLIFLLATSRHILNQWRDSINGFKSLWLISGAVLVLTEYADYTKYRGRVLYTNMIILSVFFYLCGIAHFQYPVFCRDLIMDFIPLRMFFVYLAGVCLLLGSIGILIPRYQKTALWLLGMQILGWFILLHLPRAFTLSGDDWIGVGESLAVSGICFMMYDLLGKGDLKIEMGEFS